MPSNNPFVMDTPTAFKVEALTSEAMNFTFIKEPQTNITIPKTKVRLRSISYTNTMDTKIKYLEFLVLSNSRIRYLSIAFFGVDRDRMSANVDGASILEQQQTHGSIDHIMNITKEALSTKFPLEKFDWSDVDSIVSTLKLTYATEKVDDSIE
jgi:hypothetical protein